MCDPMTLAVTSLALTAVSGVAGAVAAKQQADAQKAQANYQSAVAARNAEIAEMQREDAIERGRIEAERRRLAVQSELGSQKSLLAARGITTQGSALTILADTAAYGELDALTIEKNAEREAYGHAIKAANYESQSDLYGMQASSIHPNQTLATGLLSTASSVAGKWSSYSASGAFGSGSTGATGYTRNGVSYSGVQPGQTMFQYS